MTVGAADIALMDRWQRDFPLMPYPFNEAGRKVGYDETATIAAFRRLRDAGVLSRIGAVVRPNTAGSSLLAAMRVPPERLDDVAAIVTREPLVNHNYERAHAFNLWFVIAGRTPDAVQATVGSIERQTGIEVLQLPLVRAYHIDLGFSLDGNGAERSRRSAPPGAPFPPDPVDCAMLAALEDGLALRRRPFRELADRLDATEQAVLARLRRLIAAGVITRFGCVVRHRALGYTANAMAVWDIPDGSVDAIARRFARNARVTLCYARPRRLPDWPYNLFCMVHARARPEAYAVIDDLNLVGETALNDQAVLFSTHCFKQRGATFSEATGGLH